MKKTTRPCALGLFLWLSVLAVPAGAETVYVSGRFEIGVHDNINIDSVIVAVIPSGTPLAVIDRNGEFVEVSTPDGTKGWVDARYLVSEKPSVALLEEQEAKLQEAMRSLGATRAEVEVLRQRVTELQRDAATVTHNSPGFAKPVPIAPKENSVKLKDARRELQNLAEKNQQLKIRITDLQAIQIASAKSAARSEAKEIEATEKREGREGLWHGPVSNEARAWTPSQWLLFASILLLAFAAGGFAVDWESRRRHGGYRI